ncbi:hypothetical protein QEN19_001169 [Hanseniaspora menglaensis]
MSVLQDLTQALNIAYTNDKHETVLEIAPQIILELSKANLLSGKRNSPVSDADLKIVNQILIVVCSSSLLSSSTDHDFFAKYISLIKPTPENTDLLWLHLISLLSQGDFVHHQQLSTYYHVIIPNFDHSKYASFGKNLEVFLNEGNYGGVLKSFQEESAIDKFVLSFKSKFLKLCRTEIGNNLQSSYKNGLKLGAARTLLYFSTDVEVAAFVQERGWSSDQAGLISFNVDADDYLESYAYADKDVDTVDIVLSYVYDLERVV